MGIRARWGRFLGVAALLVPVGLVVAQEDIADCAESGDCPAAESSDARQYVPVQIRRGHRELPSLASEVAPRPGELGAGTPRRHEQQYVPVQPLGIWENTAPAGRAAPDESQSTPAEPPSPAVSSSVDPVVNSMVEREPEVGQAPPPERSASAGSGSGPYVLQLAAFRHSASIERFIQEQGLHSLALRHVNTPGRDGSWHVLIYGEYLSLGAAEEAARHFSRDYGVEPWVRPLPGSVSDADRQPDERDREPLLRR